MNEPITVPEWRVGNLWNLYDSRVWRSADPVNVDTTRAMWSNIVEGMESAMASLGITRWTGVGPHLEEVRS